MQFKRLLSAFAITAALALGGCATLTSTVAQLADHAASASPHQAATLAEALQAATLITRAVDLYVNVGNPDRATLVELKALNDAVHAALTDLEAADARGGSLTFGTFNAALDAFNAYATAKGVHR